MKWPEMTIPCFEMCCNLYSYFGLFSFSKNNKWPSKYWLARGMQEAIHSIWICSMAFKGPWLKFSLGWSDEKTVYWGLFEVVRCTADRPEGCTDWNVLPCLSESGCQELMALSERGINILEWFDCCCLRVLIFIVFKFVSAWAQHQRSWQ